ncbi:MAG: hypothetical protein F6K47_28580 [Symploca sp. SIO2E6]|nr:hypothetical protein [Symploca sp. SIO2E6]
MSFIYKLDFEIFPPFSQILESSSLDSFDLLMRSDIGELVSFEEGREVRRISIDCGNITERFYVKRNWDDFPSDWIFKKLARGKLLHNMAYNELIAIRLLESQNFPVMKPVAWGERRILGFPCEGFLLVKEVVGKDASEYWQSGDTQLRRRIMQDAGTMMARLHQAGIFDWVRLKDIICASNPQDDTNSPLNFVLIDRTCSRDRLESFSADRCYNCLAQSYGFLLKLTPAPTRREILEFTRSYLREFKDGRLNSLQELMFKTNRRLHQLSLQPGPFQGITLIDCSDWSLDQ